MSASQLVPSPSPILVEHTHCWKPSGACITETASSLDAFRTWSGMFVFNILSYNAVSHKPPKEAAGIPNLTRADDLDRRRRCNGLLFLIIYFRSFCAV